MPGIGNPILWLERQLLFAPESSFRGTPEHVGLPFENIFPVASDGVRLHGWHMPGKSPDVVWLIFHGNGGNISVRLDQYAEIHRRYDTSIIAIDYRGYGRSDGVPSEKGFYADALAAFELARELHPGKKIVVFGRSMGGAVAAQLATVVSPAALILEATLSSVLDVTHEQVPWTRYVPIGLLLRSRFDAASYVSRSSVPKLIFHGGSDTTISRTNSERIFASARPPKQIHLIPGGDHNGLDLVDPELYHGILRDFLAEFGAL
ncbi:MAG: alpha/beta fold hydrolase [Chloroflexi bacterium]|nr:alpha/beta fold hydrolase [Chloroflexota bacterium]